METPKNPAAVLLRQWADQLDAGQDPPIVTVNLMTGESTFPNGMPAQMLCFTFFNLALGVREQMMNQAIVQPAIMMPAGKMN